MLQACSTPSRLPPEPSESTTKVSILDIPNVRFFPDEQIAELVEEGLASVQREMKALGVKSPSELPEANFLAISGGGDDGAFGAGLLKGWTESGTRPAFKMVTGVSTGALIAPFAFLGPVYDVQLEKVYTRVTQKDIFIARNIIGAIFDDALSDTSPLQKLISRYMNEELLEKIAEEYDKGRLLFIGTTYLDGRRGVIWNIGAIAKSGHPDALKLFHQVLRASSAIPAAFPPVMIDVNVDGKDYQEMHVDGGAVAQLFLYPPYLGTEIRKVKRKRRAYLIRNGAIGKDWADVERSTLGIAGRAISTMIYSSGVNDLFRTYLITQRDGVEYYLAYIDSDFKGPPHIRDFDPKYMNALFDYSYQKSRHGFPWKREPPFVHKRQDAGKKPVAHQR